LRKTFDFTRGLREASATTLRGSSTPVFRKARYSAQGEDYVEGPYREFGGNPHPRGRHLVDGWSPFALGRHGRTAERFLRSDARALARLEQGVYRGLREGTRRPLVD